MALVAPIQNGQYAGNTSVDKGKKTDGRDLGYDQFLQLLVAEMQYQDPLEPTSNTEYVAQLATFSQMEATLNMQNSIDADKVNNLVGKYVIVKSTSQTTGETVAEAGFVDYVQYENGKMYLYVNGKSFTADDIYQVADVDYMEAVALADAFKASVLKMPSKDNLKLSDEEDVKKLIKVFDSLNSYQKSFIDQDTLKKFEEVIEKMKELGGLKDENAGDGNGNAGSVPDTDKGDGDTGSTDGNSGADGAQKN